MADALGSGRALCDADGSLARIAEVIRARDAAGPRVLRAAGGELRATARAGARGVPLRCSRRSSPRSGLAIDAGTGDGGLLEVLAPVYERVVAVDRSEAQLARARASASGARGSTTSIFALGELDGPEVKAAGAREGADAVFAARLLHHAPQAARFVVAPARRALPRRRRARRARLRAPRRRGDARPSRPLARLRGRRSSRRFARAAGLDDVARRAAPRAALRRGARRAPPLAARWSRGRATHGHAERRNERRPDEGKDSG